MEIKEIKAREILDSRGIPTIETTLKLDDGTQARAAVPSGASTGSTEVLEMRDGDKSRYQGKGVLNAVSIVNETIAGALTGKSFQSQAELDKFLIDLDGSPLKSNLGGNSILSVSMAYCRAVAKSKNKPLYRHFAEIYWGEGYDEDLIHMPRPMVLIMEGGKHGNWATDVQEFMIMPMVGRFDNFHEVLRATAEVFHATHDLLAEKGYATTVGFEGAFAPQELQSNEEAFEILTAGIERAGFETGKDFEFAVDVAASEFYDKERDLYTLHSEKKELTVQEWTQKLNSWKRKYPLFSIEDPYHEEAWDNWAIFLQDNPESLQLVGDDLLTTNVTRIQRGIKSKSMNSVLIKLNQIGTVSETLAAIKMTEKAGMEAIVSHRGGETNDDMIADLVVGTGASQSKFGGPDRGERLAKYNRLTEIELELDLI